MRSNRRLLFVLLIVITAVIALFFFLRRDTQAAFGSAVALCPGPDLYGYRCESGTGFSYIDATNDTHLYQDDGSIELELPFPFTFYGTIYTTIHATSNGTLHFDTDTTSFFNQCLDQGAIAPLGDMIAPFWDDLNLQSSGFLEIEAVGTAPERIFIIEWDDVPQFSDPESQVTFEVQLFEGSNDIVFLYEDTTVFEGNNGSSATIGLQSAAQGLALQYSCYQPSVANATRIRFTHSDETNADIGREVVLAPDNAQAIQAKGDSAELMTWLNERGTLSLPQLRGHWLSQNPPRNAVWEWVDVTGNGRSDLILLQHSTSQSPEYTQLVLFSESDAGEWEPNLITTFSDRETAVSTLEFVQSIDLTADGIIDTVIKNPETNDLYMVTAVTGTPKLIQIPEQCSGSFGIFETPSTNQVTLIRDGCTKTAGRTIYYWDGEIFAQQAD
ncbi:MAG: hypothetical protein GY943_26745 [Chloroflexi bacterium]|nr:hypothetical protein [Chloroflexota bacterium]